MASEDEITVWIDKLHDGDEFAAQVVWSRYSDELLRFATRRLKGVQLRFADEEDVVLSAMNSFFHRAADGQFPKLHNQTDLRKLLFTITLRKAAAKLRKHYGGPIIGGDSVFANLGQSAGLDGIAGEETGPDVRAVLNESSEALLDSLGNETLKSIAIYRLENYSNEEIAKLLNCGVRTVVRKVNRIKGKWTRTMETIE
jgi:DNA-directed RNA polymerase specialized sigma24 family protein